MLFTNTGIWLWYVVVVVLYSLVTLLKSKLKYTNGETQKYATENN